MNQRGMHWVGRLCWSTSRRRCLLCVQTFEIKLHGQHVSRLWRGLDCNELRSIRATKTSNVERPTEDELIVIVNHASQATTQWWNVVDVLWSRERARTCIFFEPLPWHSVDFKMKQLLPQFWDIDWMVRRAKCFLASALGMFVWATKS